MICLPQTNIRQASLAPGAQRTGHLAAADGDVKVLAEDAPVAVVHLVQRLLRPVAVVKELLALLGLLALLKARRLLLLGLSPPLLHHLLVEGVALLLLRHHVDAGNATASKKLHLVLGRVQRIVILRDIFFF